MIWADLQLSSEAHLRAFVLGEMLEMFYSFLLQ